MSVGLKKTQMFYVVRNMADDSKPHQSKHYTYIVSFVSAITIFSPLSRLSIWKDLHVEKREATGTGTHVGVHK